MAKKTTEQLQKEYDDIIINLKRLEDAAEQAQHSLDWFTDAANNATDEEKKRAEYNRNKAAAQKYAYEQTINQRKQELESNKRVNKSGSGANGERTIEDIEREKYKSGFSSANFKASLQSKGGMGGKAGIAAGIVDIVGNIVDVASDIYVTEQKKELNTWMAQQDQYLKTIETTNRIFQRNMKTFSKGMQGALSSSFASITQGVQEGAYAAASSSVSFATESLANTFDTALDKFKLANFKVVRQQQTELENLKLTNQQINGAVGAVSGIVGMFGPVGAVVGGLMSSIAKTTTKILEAESEIAFARLQKENEIAEAELESMNEAKKAAVEAAQESVSKVLDFSKAIENLSLKTDAAAKSMANIIGMSGGNADMYEKFIYGATRNLKFTDSTGKTTYLNKNAEDMLKMQSQYIDASGRNGTMSQKDFVKSFQLGKVIGDDNLAATLLGDMDYFNKSIATGTDLIYEMFQQANKAGVSNRKFAKDLQQNLKLAQKYTFKGGVEAMMKMSIWAQKTRFNMQGLEGMVDKIQDGGLEGVITQGAKLQVLGGNMAMGADPIAMMYESWADPEALAKRFTDMTKGTGHFNSKTGEVEIKGPDAMRLKAYAEAIGMDYKDARAQVTQRIKGEQIDKQLTKNYTDEQKALIYNKAKLGENGQWQVTLDNGEVKNVNDLKDTDWNSLMPTEESIEDYVARIYNLLEQQGGVTNFAQSVMADETFDNLKKNINERMAENLNWVTEASGTLKSMIEQSNDFVTDQNKQQHELMEATTGILSDQFKLIQGATDKLKLGLENSGSELRLALDAVKKELDYELAVIKYGENSDQAKAAASLAGVANDELAKKKGITTSQSQAPTETAMAMRTMAGNLTESELRERINNYKKLKQQHGGLTAGNKTYFDDDVLSLGHGGKEILNNLKDRGVISHNYTSELSSSEIEPIVEALEYLVEHEQELLQKTKGYTGDKHNNGTQTQPKTTGGAGYVPALSRTYQDGVSVGRNDILYSQAAAVTPIHDGMVSANGKPMYSQAAAVTPIHDGSIQMAKSDPKDVALFAKTGGPFDTLFNGIFNRIDALYEAYQDPALTPNATIETLPMEDTNVGDVIRHQWDIATSKDTYSHSSPSQPMELKISGSLDLQSGGQSVDIMGMLRDNPLFIRELSRLLANQLSNAQNGGRGVSNLSQGSL